MKKLYQYIAELLVAVENCKRTNNEPWRKNHSATIEHLVREFMPSGSGWDNGTKIDIDSCSPNKLTFYGSFHHMNDVGYYDGWTDHSIIVTPHLAYDFSLRITGRNRNDIKEYLHELFEHALNQDIQPYIDEQQYKLRLRSASFRKAFQFFFDQAGYVVGRRAIGAFNLAKAELYAERNKLTFLWDYDPDGELGDHAYWCKDARRWQAGYETDGTEMYRGHGYKKLKSPDCSHDVLYCVAKDAEGNVVASLGSIIDPSPEYRRVVEAELTSEAMDNGTSNRLAVIR